MKTFKSIVVSLLFMTISASSQTVDSRTQGSIDASVDSILKLPNPNLAYILDHYEGASRYCEVSHLYFKSDYEQSRSTAKQRILVDPYDLVYNQPAWFSWQVIEGTGIIGKCGWTEEERCQATEALFGIFLHNKLVGPSSESQQRYDSVVFYGNQVKKKCNRDPYFGEYRGIQKYDELLQYLKDPEAYNSKLIVEQELSRYSGQTTEDFNSKGYVYKNHRMYKEALESYKQAYKVAKTDEDKFGAYMSQIEMIDEKYLPDSAIHMWQRCKINGYAIRCKTEIANLYYQAGKYEKAIAALKAGLVIWTNNAPDENTILVRNDLCSSISDCYYKLGDIANGKKYYIMSR